MGKETTFKLQTTIHRRGEKYSVTLEANGFSGEAESYELTVAFGSAYQDLTEKLLEGTTTE